MTCQQLPVGSAALNVDGSVPALRKGFVLSTLAVAWCASCAGPGEGSLVEDESVLERPAAAPDLTVTYGAAGEQLADIRYGNDSAAAKRPLVILIHGGFWRPAYDRKHTGPMSVALASAGWTVATIEYRRVPGYPELTLEDVTNAVTALPALVERHNGTVVLIGHSAGGHLVLWAGATTTNPNVAAVLALAPAADLQLAQQLNLGSGAVRAFLGVDAKSRRDVDPKLLPAPRAGVTIVQGQLDEVVPPEVARSYVSTHPATRLIEVAGAGHFAVIDPLSAAWPTVVSELERLSPKR